MLEQYRIMLAWRRTPLCASLGWLGLLRRLCGDKCYAHTCYYTPISVPARKMLPAKDRSRPRLCAAVKFAYSPACVFAAQRNASARARLFHWSAYTLVANIGLQLCRIISVPLWQRPLASGFNQKDLLCQPPSRLLHYRLIAKRKSRFLPLQTQHFSAPRL